MIHIGVGSDVVCSTLIGSARASMCGMDNRTIPRFFVNNGLAAKVGRIFNKQRISLMMYPYIEIKIEKPIIRSCARHGLGF